MLNSFHVSAAAKVNIGLSVYPVRSDGYHDIVSIFTSVPLSDELYVTLRSDCNICNVDCGDMILPEKNTLSLTYQAFSMLTDFTAGIDVKLKKHIPAGGGLGGGSSDAASLLFALEKLSGIKLSMEDRYRIAAKVGSDVFFFLHCWQGHTGCAIVRGRGEVIKEIPRRADIFFVLVCPPVHSSTKEAYALVDYWYQQKKYNESFYDLLVDEELERLYNSPVAEWTFKNTFTPALVEKYPVIGQAMADIRDCGADFVEMSGSGASVFGVFSSAEAAQVACNKLCHKWNCFVLT